MKKGAKKKTLSFLVLHGPNLNLLGEREPEIYGKMTLPEINRELIKFAKSKGIKLKIAQSNHEGELVDLLHANRKWADGIVFNPAAFTHYSYALRDAIASIQVPTAEVHLSDIKKREKFRQISVIKAVCEFQVSGLGWKSYIKGIELLAEKHHGR